MEVGICRWLPRYQITGVKYAALQVRRAVSVSLVLIENG
jgi:hypothetical protein